MGECIAFIKYMWYNRITMKVRVKRLHPEVKLPSYAHLGDAGMDLYVPERFELAAGERKSIPLGIAVQIPKGYVGFLSDKSSISHKHGVESFGNVVDAGYRGEIHAGVSNVSDKPYVFEKGDKIIQMLILPVSSAKIVEVKKLSISERGEHGFGSTGKQ